MDTIELFSDLDLGTPAVAGDACARPIGRRTGRPSRPRPAARPSPALALLGELRRMLAALTADQQHRFRHLDRATGRQARTIADLAEAVDQLRVRLAALERQLGTIEPPAAPRPSRRSPCA